MPSRRFTTVVTLVIVVAFVVVAVAPAFASATALPGSTASLVLHSRLLGSTPQDGSSVPSASRVVLTFNEDVNPDFVKVAVKGPNGLEARGAPAVDAREVTQDLAQDLPAGKHAVTYRVVSTDGHPVSGTVTFTTTQAAASASTGPSPSPSASATAADGGSVVASPAPSAAPASGDSGSGSVPWLVVGAVAVLVVLGLGAAWRSMGGGRTVVETDGGDDRGTGTEGSGAVPPGPA